MHPKFSGSTFPFQIICIKKKKKEKMLPTMFIKGFFIRVGIIYLKKISCEKPTSLLTSSPRDLACSLSSLCSLLL